MSNRHSEHKALVAPLRAAMYDFNADRVRAALDELAVPEAVFRMCHPIGTILGAQAFYAEAYAPLFIAIPDLERRDTIVIAGADDHDQDWVGCAGYYTGTFAAPWLDIPPTGHQIGMRFHEFYRFCDGKLVELHAIWDIPEVMMQASAWPMAPSLGREWQVPGPATQDGVVSNHDPDMGQDTCRLVLDMLDYLQRHPAQGGPETMEMDRFWHPRMNWYGPAGIGTCRGISGFRNWHQIPFLAAMPDRGQFPNEATHHFFGDANYAAVTGWPNMTQTLSYGGWLGIAPTEKKISLRSLDFWRVEGGLIRENWVLLDFLDIYRQLGVDVLARLREFNKARNLGAIDIHTGQIE
ncbi:ester cyclase [Cochlodiniinecator piscidefendens]|uniref:ester cyclase n=1 Tax=Cochlodiniinecator piscidefendens TaxID=2715756 RepID=UPI001408C670|nr:ester cyclase [Cochlodiniinecator piscidefendens]